MLLFDINDIDFDVGHDVHHDVGYDVGYNVDYDVDYDIDQLRQRNCSDKHNEAPPTSVETNSRRPVAFLL